MYIYINISYEALSISKAKICWIMLEYFHFEQTFIGIYESSYFILMKLRNTLGKNNVHYWESINYE